MSFTKHDSEKLLFDAIDPWFLHELAEVLTDGARKYSKNNWQACPEPFERYYAALQRHLNAYARGETKDPDSGRSHLMHAACCLLFLRFFERNNEASTGRVPDPVQVAEPAVDHTGTTGSAAVAWEFLGAGR